MKKYLLATTAAIALIATPMAYAQDSGTATQNAPIFSQEPYKGVAPVDGFYSADPSQVLATRFIGANIHAGASADAETIGDVNDIIMTPDGRAVAVIAGVGGFLGLGEKEVAVSMDALTWVTDANGDKVLVGNFTKEQLEAAPEFDRDALKPESVAQLPADKSVPADQQPADQSMAQTQQTPPAGTATDQSMANAEQRMNADEPTANDSMTTAATPKMETIPVADAKLKASDLMGMKVVAADDETVGEVSDVLIDDGGKVEAFVIDVGGFLGMNEKPVAVSMQDLQIARAEGSDDWTEIKTGLTKEALEKQKAFSEAQYKDDRDQILLIAPVN